MTRPDEIAALADEVRSWIKDIDFGRGPAWYRGKVVAFRKIEKALRLSAASPGDGVRDRLDAAREKLCLEGHNLTLGHKLDGFDLAYEAALAPAEKKYNPAFVKEILAADAAQPQAVVKNADELKSFLDAGAAGQCDAIGKLKNLMSATPTPPSGDVAKRVYSALFEPAEIDAIDNLEGALIDIKRLSDAGKPADAVCIRTIERVQQQLIKAHEALIQSAASGGGTESDVIEQRSYDEWASPEYRKMIWTPQAESAARAGFAAGWQRRLGASS